MHTYTETDIACRKEWTASD